MELRNKSVVLMVPLIYCLLLISGIDAVPSYRIELVKQELLKKPSSAATVAAPAPSPSGKQVLGLEVNTVASPHNAQLDELCKDAESIPLCVRTIAPSIKGALDPVEALKIEMGATMNMTTKVSELIKTLQAKPETSKDEKESLDVCADQYSSIVDTINDCLDSIKQNAVYDAWVKFAAVLSYQQACEDAFKEGGSPIPFPEDSKIMYQLGGNCLAILMRLSGGTSTY